MTVSVTATSKIVELVIDPTRPTITCPARVWEGVTASGIPVNVFITRIVPLIAKDDPAQAEFQRELQEVEPPSVTADAWPTRLVL